MYKDKDYLDKDYRFQCKRVIRNWFLVLTTESV